MINVNEVSVRYGQRRIPPTPGSDIGRYRILEGADLVSRNGIIKIAVSRFEFISVVVVITLDYYHGKVQLPMETKQSFINMYISTFTFVTPAISKDGIVRND